MIVEWRKILKFYKKKPSKANDGRAKRKILSSTNKNLGKSYKGGKKDDQLDAIRLDFEDANIN